MDRVLVEFVCTMKRKYEWCDDVSKKIFDEVHWDMGNTPKRLIDNQA